MNGAPLYIYGIMASPGIVPAGAGIGGAAMEIVTGGPLSALVSRGIDPKLPRMRRHLLVHTKVLEQAMASCTILPLRFGTIAPDAADLTACLRQHAAGFQSALASIEGRIEMGVKASWREQAIYADILQQDAGLRALRDRLQSQNAAETYYNRIELGRRVEAALAAHGEACVAAILAALSPLAERHVELACQEDGMILNRAFLLQRKSEPAFDAAMEHIADRYGEKLNLRYVGPVPPFNFVSLHTNWLAEAAA